MLAIVSSFQPVAAAVPTEPAPPVVLVDDNSCNLSIQEAVFLIYEASSQTDMPFFVSFVRFIFGVNTIECIPAGFRVSLQEINPDHGFVIIDILDDL